MRTGALIIASGNLETKEQGSEEMQTFLPMLPLDGSTVIKRQIFTLRKAGVTPVIVLCGYQQEVLKNHLSHNGVIFCEDEDYDRHDRQESLRLGLEFARAHCDQVLVIPVEYPVFSLHTVEHLLKCEENTVPVCHGKQGWPRLYIFQRQQGAEPWPGAVPEQVRADTELLVEDEGVFLSLLDADGIRKIQEYAKAMREANALQVKTKVILTKEEDFFGPGIYQLLEYIDETGSILAAASQMNMSYTKCWKMINKAEKEMGFPFLNRVNGGKHGGSSTITEEGRQFMERYHAMVEDMKRISQSFFDRYFEEFQ